MSRNRKGERLLTPWYITGFCDGEASFTYSRSGSRGVNLYFAIRLRSDDRPIIEEIQNFFGVGKIYTVKARPPGRHSGFTKESTYYRVTRIHELAKIVQHFDKYPLTSKKAKPYQIWRKMVKQKQNFRRQNPIQAHKLAQQLSGLNSKGLSSKIVQNV